MGFVLGQIPTQGSPPASSGATHTPPLPRQVCCRFRLQEGSGRQGLDTGGGGGAWGQGRQGGCVCRRCGVACAAAARLPGGASSAAPQP